MSASYMCKNKILLLKLKYENLIDDYLLGCDIIWTCRCVLTFRTDTVSLSLRQKWFNDVLRMFLRRCLEIFRWWICCIFTPSVFVCLWKSFLSEFPLFKRFRCLTVHLHFISLQSALLARECSGLRAEVWPETLPVLWNPSSNDWTQNSAAYTPCKGKNNYSGFKCTIQIRAVARYHDSSSCSSAVALPLCVQTECVGQALWKAC